MKILMVTERYPFPPFDGVNLKVYHLIKGLFNKGHNIFLVSFTNHNEDINYGDMNKYCEIIDLIHKKPIKFRFIKALFNIFENKPFSLKPYNSKLTMEKIKTIIEKGHFDIVHFDMCNMAQFYIITGNSPAVIVPNDAIHISEKTKALYNKNLIWKAYYYMQYRKWRKYESDAYTKFAKCIVVSEADKKALLSNNSNLDITVAPNGVDIDYFRPLKLQKEYPSLIFTGSMSSFQSYDAVLYFYEMIFTRLISKVPNIKLLIVGKNPHPSIQKLANNKSIVVTGFVEDLRPYIDKSTIYICPMRAGAGIKNRLLEAMAMEKPIIATRKSCETIDAIHMEHIYIADSPSEFVDGIIRLLKNNDLRNKLATNARDLARENYSWQKTISIYEKCYLEAIDKISK
jgi:sugar transferase (PEP-CTERM/EpsH1 system associated)